MNLPPLKPTANALASEVRAARRRRKLTQKALASLAEIDLATLRNLEGGRGTVTSLVAVLSALQHRFSEQPSDLPLGGWLLERHKQSGLTLRQLCAQAGISKPSVIQYVGT